MGSRKRRTESNAAFQHELKPLVEAAASGRLILFAGGGVSQNLGLPDFKALVAHLAEELHFKADRFDASDYAIVAEASYVTQTQLGKLRSWMGRAWHGETIRIADPELHNLIVDLVPDHLYDQL